MKAKYINLFTDFDKAEIAKYSVEERHEYGQSLKIYRDQKNRIDTAFEDDKTEVV